MNVLVLGGGSSSERFISLRSAQGVAAALKEAGFNVLQRDPKDKDYLNDLPANTIVFPILHGKGGEDGKVQKELEQSGLYYLGTSSKPSVNCFDKAKTRQILADHNLPIANGEVIHRNEYQNHPLAKGQHVLKTRQEGSSIGTLIVKDPQHVDAHDVDEVFSYAATALIEEYVQGIEITVPLLDKAALPVIEIRPPAAGGFNFENKYNGATEELCPAVSISEPLQQKAQRLAEQVHSVMDCRHISRTDMIIKDDGSMIILEINTMPGMTDQSLYPLSARTAGLSFPGLMTEFVNLVKRDYGL